MKYKKYILYITAVTALILSACGGGNGGDGKFNNTPGKNDITLTGKKVKSCTSGFSSLKKGDKITSLLNDTKLQIRHKEDGTREVCIKTGDARIN